MNKIIIIVIVVFNFSVADEFVESSTVIGGYGELHYDIEANDGDGNLDFHRFILYVKHIFNSEWSMMSEIEVEHNIVYSEGDGGYLAMEQAYLNYWNGNWGWKGGVVLVPAGITNEYHEPPTFMSVERPEYSKYIIPTTWFDNGFSFYGNTDVFNWNFTMVGDLDGDEIGEGIRDARLKGVSTSTSSWTKTLQFSWTAIPGLKLGGSITMNDAPKDDGTSVGVTLTEMNTTYSANNMYARFEYGKIDYTDNPLGVASSSGYYLDLGYNLADMVGCNGDLYLWTRTSVYTKNSSNYTDISLFGVTFKPVDNIAIKFETGSKSNAWPLDDSDIMRMGIGYMF